MNLIDEVARPADIAMHDVQRAAQRGSHEVAKGADSYSRDTQFDSVPSRYYDAVPSAS